MTRFAALLTVALGCAACLARESTPDDGSQVVYRGPGSAIAGPVLLTTDKRLRCGSAEFAGSTVDEPVLQLTVDGEGLRADGAVLVSRCDTPSARVVATGVERILGGGAYRRLDGSVFSLDGDGAPLELDSLRGATSCATTVCVRGGTSVPNAARRYVTITIPAPLANAIDVSDFGGMTDGFSPERLLTSDGAVFTVAATTTADRTTVSFTRIDGLPLITRMDGWFMYASDGTAYYAGTVWDPGAPPHLQTGLSTTMLPPGASTIECPHPPQKAQTLCVGPTEVPRLKGARIGSTYFLATYAITPNGTVKCWATEPTRYPSDAPRCLSFD